MELEEYRAMYELEDNFWWYVGQRKMAASMLSICQLDTGRAKILDVGCGTGANIFFLQNFGTVSGVDMSSEALAYCKIRGIEEVRQGDALALPYNDSSFDLVTSFDVIYHAAIKDDLLAIREMHRVLKMGGYLLVRVPAYDSLRGHHDLAVHTRHRYTTDELGSKLTLAGFELIKLTYANTLLFPIAVLKRIAERKKPGTRAVESDVRPISRHANRLLGGVMSIEAKILKQVNLPFGLSVFCLARKL